MHRGGRARTSAYIRVHPRVTRSLTHVIIQNMYFIYYITHKIIKLFKNIA